MSDSVSLTCGTCRHWIALPIDLTQQAITEQRGECRWGPPGVTIRMGQDRFNRQVTAVLAAYPQLPATFAACGQHRARVELPVLDAAGAEV